MSLNEIIKLGNPILYKQSEQVDKSEVADLIPLFEKMWHLIEEFRSQYGRGRAIAAPQIGILKRIICINTDKRYVLINPTIEYADDELMEVWDDCMSFPDLFVKVKRHRSIKISFYNPDWEKVIWELKDDMSELFQHEYDHLNGILAIDRAEDMRSFRWTDY